MSWAQQQPLQPQYTSYNVSPATTKIPADKRPFHAQMLAQQQQEEYMRQQMLQQQQQEWLAQQAALQQQQYLQQQHTSLMPQQTGYGSNNPFAPAGPQRSLLGDLAEEPSSSYTNGSSSFLPVPQVSQAPSTPPPPQPQLPPQQSNSPFRPAVKKDDGQHSQLANLIGRGREDGLDTFGNAGNLRESLSLLRLRRLNRRYPCRIRLSLHEHRSFQRKQPLQQTTAAK